MTSAHADSVAELNRPSSTIAGCRNTWNPTDPAYGSSTCEGRAVAQIWQERATAIVTTRNILIDAARNPDHADKETVRGALNTLATTADAITDSYHPQPPLTDAFVAALAWMRLQFEGFDLPIPVTLGDGFRTLAAILGKPMRVKVHRNEVYDRGAAMAEALNDAVTESINPEAQETNAAVLAAHQEAVLAAQSAENGFYNAATAAAVIAKAAGPDNASIADGQARILQASLARYPHQSGYFARTGRRLGAVPDGLFGLLALCMVFALMSFRAWMTRSSLRRHS